ncbi:MAG TPA: response regulator [Stellaceae bacterium]|jgi:DNA-binding NtrC family response regulator|nr:response regulator [Stellaceae bacterium]
MHAKLDTDYDFTEQNQVQGHWKLGDNYSKGESMLEDRLEVSQAGPTILVVDDDPQVRDLAVMMLEDTGFSVLEASSGEAALDSLRQHPDVRLLFTDIRMPGMDGVELAGRAVELYPNLKVVFTTGYMIRRPPANMPIVPKPYRIDLMLNTVRDSLNS